MGERRGLSGQQDLRAPLGAFRATMTAICALLCLTPARDGSALLLVLPLAVAAWPAYHSPRFAGVWRYVESPLTALAVPLAGGASSPLLPYLMASGLSVGLTGGWQQLVAVSGLSSGALLLGGTFPEADVTGDYVVVGAQWVLLSTAVGLVALWTRWLMTPVGRSDDYQEVRRLLAQVRNLSRHLPGSLDATGAAEVLVGRCLAVAPSDRAAVLVQSGEGVFVPLALTGDNRVPWRAPLAEDGPLRQAWQSGLPALDRRGVDTLGRRRGSVVLAVPLLASEGPFGLLILEVHDPDGFPPSVVTRLLALAAEAGPQLETAMLFDEVRLEATTEERDRLARDMHDGIAQELAYLGYQLDDLRQRAQPLDADLAEQVGGIRGDLTTLMSDLRLSITDLRTTLRPERGLGAALSTYLRAVCAGRDVVLNLSLQETAFRLPAEQESALLRAAHLFSQEVRRAAGARELTVHLVVDPPSAVLQLSCDAPLPQLAVNDLRDLVSKVGGSVTILQGATEPPSVTISLKGRDHDDSPAGGRPRAHPTGAAAGLRAD